MRNDAAEKRAAFLKKVIALTGIILIAVALTALVLFLRQQKLDRADKFSSVIGVFVALVAVVVPVGRRLIRLLRPRQEEPELPDSKLNEVARKLATAVQAQWRGEEHLRRLQDPSALPVRWVAADAMIMDHSENVMGTTDISHLRDISGELTKIVEVFNSIPSRRLVILGKPGAGKTVLTIRFVLDQLARRRDSEPVPVIFSLGSWDPTQQGLNEWLISRLGSDYRDALRLPGVSLSFIGRELVQRGRVLPVLDGLDEMVGQLRPKALKTLNATLSRGDPVLLTCRKDEYISAVHASDVLTAAAVAELLPLRLSELKHFLPLTTRKKIVGGEVATKWEPFLARLSMDPPDTTAEMVLRVLSTPLMTSLARAAYSDTDDDPCNMFSTDFGTDAQLEGHLLDQLIPAALTNNDQEYSVTHSWSIQQVQRWLTFLATYLGANRDLKWWRLEDAVHRSVFEVFGCVVAVGVAAPATAFTGDPVLGAVLGGLTLGLVDRSPGAVPSAVAPQLRGARGRAVWRIARAFVGGFFIGVAISLSALAICYGIGFNISSVEVAVLAPALGVLNGLVFGLNVWLDVPTEIARAVQPSTVLRADRATTLARGLTLGVAGGLAFALIAWFEETWAVFNEEPIPVGLLTFVLSVGFIVAVVSAPEQIASPLAGRTFRSTLGTSTRRLAISIAAGAATGFVVYYFTSDVMSNPEAGLVLGLGTAAVVSLANVPAASTQGSQSNVSAATLREKTSHSLQQVMSRISIGIISGLAISILASPIVWIIIRDPLVFWAIPFLGLLLGLLTGLVGGLTSSATAMDRITRTDNDVPAAYSTRAIRRAARLVEGLLFGLVFGFTFDIIQSDPTINNGLITGVASGLIAGLVGGTINASGQAGRKSAEAEPPRGSRRSIRRLVLALTLGVGAGIATGFGGYYSDVLFSTLIIISIMVAIAVASGIWFGSASGIVDAAKSAVALRNERVASLPSAVLFGALFGVLYPALRNVPFGLGAGEVFGIAVFGLAGGVFISVVVMNFSSWAGFIFARAWLAIRGLLPWRLMTFLEDVHQVGLLRQDGGVFQFRHFRLQERLVERAKE